MGHVMDHVMVSNVVLFAPVWQPGQFIGGESEIGNIQTNYP